jgi:hypothetical protein
MERYASSNALREAIIDLERQQAAASRQITVQLIHAVESMKPINLIKNTLNEVTESKEMTDNILKTSIGLVAGYITQSLFQRPSHGPLRRLLGVLFSYGITHFLATNPEMLTAIGAKIGHFFKKMMKRH